MPEDQARGALKIRIVLADDHPTFADGLTRLLTMEPDFEVVAQVVDGDQALGALQRYAPDILLLDLKMPGVDGWTTLQRMQRRKDCTRVIVLSASEDQEDFVQALKFGASGIVPKWRATQVLVNAIRCVHAGEIVQDRAQRISAIQSFAAPGTTAFPGSRRRRSPLLTVREREMAALVAQGFKNKEVAQKMLVSEQTVKNRMRTIFDKLEVSDRLGLVLHTIHETMHAGRSNSSQGTPRQKP